MLIAKGNQPTLYEDLALFFDEPPVPCASWHCVTTLNKGHGRLERRTITTSTELREWFARDWCGIEQVFRIEREGSKPGNTSRKASLWHHELVRAAGRAWRDWATGKAALVVRLPTPLAAGCTLARRCLPGTHRGGASDSGRAQCRSPGPHGSAPCLQCGCRTAPPCRLPDRGAALGAGATLTFEKPWCVSGKSWQR